jgi:hypothetical protein
MKTAILLAAALIASTLLASAFDDRDRELEACALRDLLGSMRAVIPRLHNNGPIKGIDMLRNWWDTRGPEWFIDHDHALAVEDFNYYLWAASMPLTYFGYTHDAVTKALDPAISAEELNSAVDSFWPITKECRLPPEGDTGAP